MIRKGLLLMNNTKATDSHQPAAVRLIQILIYLAAVFNVINGLYSFGSPDSLKKWISITMIATGVAAAYVGFRMQNPSATGRTTAIVISVIMIVLRLIEFAVWLNVGFIIGVILPVFVIWRLSTQEAKTWFEKE